MKTTGSLFMFLGTTTALIAFFWVIIANGTPQEQHAHQPQEEELFEEYNPPKYLLPNGATSTLSGCCGVEITEEEYKQINE